MDPNIRALTGIILLVVVVAGIHNLVLGDEDTYSLGYCDSFIVCAGVNVGFCLGVEQLDITCYDPATNYDKYRTVEMDCLLQGSALCKEGVNDWGTNATYEGRTCSDWSAQDERIDILPCDQFFKDSTGFDKIV